MAELLLQVVQRKAERRAPEQEGVRGHRRARLLLEEYGVECKH